MDEKEFAVAGKSVLSANFVGIGASGYRPAVNLSLPFAQVAELADALDSGSSVRKDVEVRILSWAPLFQAPAARIQRRFPSRSAQDMRIPSWAPNIRKNFCHRRFILCCGIGWPGDGMGFLPTSNYLKSLCKMARPSTSLRTPLRLSKRISSLRLVRDAWSTAFASSNCRTATRGSRS